MKKTDGRNANGGPRKGSGRKAKYNEPTALITFRWPLSVVRELKEIPKSNELILTIVKDAIQNKR